MFLMIDQKLFLFLIVDPYICRHTAAYIHGLQAEYNHFNHQSDYYNLVTLF